MAEERNRRRLAAILAADVVGYSALMEADEGKTLSRLKKLRSEILDPAIAEFGGRVFKTTGDGILIEFPSAVDAVNHAVNVQRALIDQQDSVSEERKIRFRIGISLGDVIVDGEDLYGNGVNIATRLEALAEPGGIMVSGTVRESVGNETAVAFDDLGEHQVKNIKRPIRVYSIKFGPESAPVSEGGNISDRASIAILPFSNMSGDPEQEYFSDGISEDIITALSRARWFRVVSRNSAFVYKSASLNIRQVAQELGVRYVLEGSVRKAGNRVRITAQLIDGVTDNHLWAERYDRELEDVFEVQDEITASISAAIEPELSRAEFNRAMIVRPDSLTVWDIYQRGLWHVYGANSDHFKALAYFRQAAKLDPNFGLAYSGIGLACHYILHYAQVEDGEPYIEEGMAAARRALEIDNDDPRARLTLGRIHMKRGNYEEALAQLQYAVRLHPLSAEPRVTIGRVLVDLGRFSDALEAMHEALRMCPNDVAIGIVMARLAEANFHLGEYDEAIKWLRQAARQSYPPRMWGRATLLAALGYKGDADGSKAELESIRKHRPEFSLTFVRQHYPVHIPEALDRMINGLRKAGVPD